MWWKNFKSHDEMKTRKFKYSSNAVLSHWKSISDDDNRRWI